METITIKTHKLRFWEQFIDIKDRVQKLSIREKYSISIYDLSNKDEVMIHVNKLEEYIRKEKNTRDVLNKIERLIPSLSKEYEGETKEVKFDDVNEEDLKKIFSYIYWKYKHKDSNQNIHIVNLKRMLGVDKSNKTYIEPVAFQKKCHCGELGVLRIYNYECASVSSFECSCGHKESRNSGFGFRDILKSCKCKYCTELKNQLFYILKYNLRTWIEYITQMIKEQYMSLKNINDVNDREMLADYEENFKTLSEVESELVGENLRTYEELKKCLNKILKTKFDNDDKVMYETFRYMNSLRKKKVIYDVCKKNPNSKLDDIVETIIFNNLIYIRHNKVKKLSNSNNWTYLNEALMYMETCDVDEFYNEVWKKSFEINDIKIYFELLFGNMMRSNEISIRLGKEYFNTYSALNKYYVNKEENTNRKITINTSLIKNIFKDKNQKEQFIRIYAEFKNLIIIPNVEFKKIVDLDRFKSVLKEEEFNCLKTCTLDFVVYNLDGEIEKVIDSHEEEIKRRILNFLNIEYSSIK